MVRTGLGQSSISSHNTLNIDYVGRLAWNRPEVKAHAEMRQADLMEFSEAIIFSVDIVAWNTVVDRGHADGLTPTQHRVVNNCWDRYISIQVGVICTSDPHYNSFRHWCLDALASRDTKCPAWAVVKIVAVSSKSGCGGSRTASGNQQVALASTSVLVPVW